MWREKGHELLTSVTHVPVSFLVWCRFLTSFSSCPFPSHATLCSLSSHHVSPGGGSEPAGEGYENRERGYD